MILYTPQRYVCHFMISTIDFYDYNTAYQYQYHEIPYVFIVFRHIDIELLLHAFYLWGFTHNIYEFSSACLIFSLYPALDIFMHSCVCHNCMYLVVESWKYLFCHAILRKSPITSAIFLSLCFNLVLLSILWLSFFSTTNTKIPKYLFYLLLSLSVMYLFLF